MLYSFRCDQFDNCHTFSFYLVNAGSLSVTLIEYGWNLLGSLLCVTEICFPPKLLFKAWDIEGLFTFQFTQGHSQELGRWWRKVFWSFRLDFLYDLGSGLSFGILINAPFWIYASLSVCGWFLERVPTGFRSSSQFIMVPWEAILLLLPVSQDSTVGSSVRFSLVAE